MVGLLKVEAKNTAEPPDLVERRLEMERLEMKLLHGHEVVEAGGGGGVGGGAAAAAQNGVQSVYKDTPGKKTLAVRLLLFVE